MSIPSIDPKNNEYTSSYLEYGYTSTTREEGIFHFEHEPVTTLFKNTNPIKKVTNQKNKVIKVSPALVDVAKINKVVDQTIQKDSDPDIYNNRSDTFPRTPEFTRHIGFP